MNQEPNIAYKSKSSIELEEQIKTIKEKLEQITKNLNAKREFDTEEYLQLRHRIEQLLCDMDKYSNKIQSAHDDLNKRLEKQKSQLISLATRHHRSTLQTKKFTRSLLTSLLGAGAFLSIFLIKEQFLTWASIMTGLAAGAASLFLYFNSKITKLDFSSKQTSQLLQEVHALETEIQLDEKTNQQELLSLKQKKTELNAIFQNIEKIIEEEK